MQQDSKPDALPNTLPNSGELLGVLHEFTASRGHGITAFTQVLT